MADGTVVMMKRKVCSDCTNAAFDDGGVYCKEFGEQILNENVAADCGAFEMVAHAQVRIIHRGFVSSEADRSVSVQVDVDFFGKESHGDQIVNQLERELILRFGDRVSVKQLGTERR